MDGIAAICKQGPVIPVIEIDDANDAIALSKALLAGGISVIEITLRTSAALRAIELAATVNGLYVGAGTLLLPDQVPEIVDAGASFVVSPGTTEKLIEACKEKELPFLPGAATVSEVIKLRSYGFSTQKFFPAEAAGGIAMLKAISGPVDDVSFCPTGGVSQHNASDYLAQKNVACVGGSWIAPRSLIAEKNWKQIETNARAASILA